MRWCRAYSLGLLLLFCAPLEATDPAPDAFLDRPMPMPAEVTSFQYLDQIKALQALVGKPMLFPDGFMDYLDKTNPKMNCRWGNDPTIKVTTLRKYLQSQGANLGLALSYDAGLDVMRVDFPWHKDASQGGSQLMNMVRDLPPTDEKQSVALRQGNKIDDWMTAFDALLSLSKNFSYGWKVHLANQLTMAFLFPSFGPLGDQVYAYTLKDTAGSTHLLVLADNPPMVMPGPRPCVTYYLFDGDGLLEDGGTFEAGDRWMAATFNLKDAGNRLVVETIRSTTTRWSYTAALNAGKFDAASAGEFNWGWPGLGFADAGYGLTFRLTTTTVIARYDYVLTVVHGEMHPALFKNDAPFMDYSEAGVGPLREISR